MGIIVRIVPMEKVRHKMTTNVNLIIRDNQWVVTLDATGAVIINSAEMPTPEEVVQAAENERYWLSSAGFEVMVFNLQEPKPEPVRPPEPMINEDVEYESVQGALAHVFKLGGVVHIKHEPEGGNHAIRAQILNPYSKCTETYHLESCSFEDHGVTWIRQ